MIQVFGIDADTLVNHADKIIPIEFLELHRHLPTLRRVFYCIIQDISYHLAYTQVIGLDRAVPCLNIEVDGMEFGTDLGMVYTLSQQVSQVKSRVLQMQLSPLHAGEIKQVVHQPFQVLCLAWHDMQAA